MNPVLHLLEFIKYVMLCILYSLNFFLKLIPSLTITIGTTYLQMGFLVLLETAFAILTRVPFPMESFHIMTKK